MTSAPSGHGDTFAGDATLEVVALGGLREFGMPPAAMTRTTRYSPSTLRKRPEDPDELTDGA